MSHIVDFKNVSTTGLESSPVAEALAGLRANEARYFMNKYKHAFAVVPAGESQETLDYVNCEFLEADVVIAIGYDIVEYAEGDALLFGPESRGLPGEVIDSLPAEQRLRLPMRPGNRSLNLSNAVAVLVYEAWRQRGFDGADTPGS